MKTRVSLKYFVSYCRLESNYDLPLNKILNIPVSIIIVNSVFQEDNNYYPQVLLYECLHEYEE